MKNQTKNLAMNVFAVSCGALAGVLRMELLSTGVDEKGLLTTGNPLNYALLAVVIGYLVAAFFLVRRLESGSVEELFPACKIRAALSVAGGGLLAVHSAQIIAAQRLAGILGLTAGVCMIITGLCRWSGKRPSPLFHCLVCVFFIIRLILGFQSWGANPQLQEYALQLLAGVSLMLFAFHRASCDAGMINRKRTACFGLLSVFFCIASVSDEAAPLFYAACGLWAIGAGSAMQTLPEAPENA